MACWRGFGLAAAEREAGKTAEAAAAYEAIAKGSGVDALLADYAQLQAAMPRLDSANWTDMQNWSTPLAADGNAWRFSARELLGLAAQKAGKLDDVCTEYQRLLSDRGTPPSIAERAPIMLAMLTEGGVDRRAGLRRPGKGQAKPADKKSK